jgi:hypothetical protein
LKGISATSSFGKNDYGPDTSGLETMKKKVAIVSLTVAVVFLTAIAGGGWLLIYLVFTGDDTSDVLAAIRVSREVIEPIARLEVDQETDVNEEVLGAQVLGTNRTTAKVRIKLTPNSMKAVFELSLVGESVSDTTATKGPAQVSTHSVTPFKAVKFIVFDGNSFTTTPAEVTTEPTELTINEIASTATGLWGRVVTRVATREVQKSYEQSRQLAAEKTAARVTQVAQQFDADVQEHLDKLNHDLQLDELLNEQFDLEKVSMQLSTTEEHLLVVFLNRPDATQPFPDFIDSPDSPVQAGLNLKALAINPQTTVGAVRALYQEHAEGRSNEDAPDVEDSIEKDLRIGFARLEQRGVWTIIHFAQEHADTENRGGADTK